MKVRIFVLGAGDSEDREVLDLMIHRTFSRVLTDENAVSYYEAIRDAIPNIGKAFGDSDVVLFFSSGEMFPRVKLVLAKALGLTMKTDEALLLTAKKADPEGSFAEDFSLRNADIPEGGIPFALSDACDTGFGVHKGRQTIIVLPAAVDRTGIVLAQQVIPFLNDLYEEDLSPVFASHIQAFALENKLNDKDVAIAVSDTKTTAMLKKYLSHTPGLDARMPVAAKGEQRGNTPPDEYAVNLSITAAEFMGAPYGVAMTNAYYTGDDAEGERVVYLSVTSETENTVREITSFYGESTPELMLRCCGELCALIGQIIDVDDGVLRKQPVGVEKKKTGKGAFAALLVLLLAAIAGVCGFGYYYFSTHDYTLRDWLQTYLPAVTREAETTTAAEAAPTVAGDETETRETAAADGESEAEAEENEEETAVSRVLQNE